MELPDAINQFRAILTQKLCRKQERTEFVEVVMVLLVGMLWGLFNPHQVAQQLGVSPKELYATLHSMSAASWRRLLDEMMVERALDRLRHYEQASRSTKSRRQASLSIDDSVVKRYGKLLSYVWPCYSGQVKHVVRGQDVVGIVLRIGSEIIPLRLAFVSKQGRGPTTKPALLIREMEQLKAYFAGHGIDLTELGVSLDSWWINQGVSAELARLGFVKQVIAAKRSLVLESRDGRASLGERKKHAVRDLRLGTTQRGTTSARRESQLGSNGGHHVRPSTVEDVCGDLSVATVAHLRRVAHLGEPSGGGDLLEATQEVAWVRADAEPRTTWGVGGVKLTRGGLLLRARSVRCQWHHPRADNPLVTSSRDVRRVNQ